MSDIIDDLLESVQQAGGDTDYEFDYGLFLECGGQALIENNAGEGIAEDMEVEQAVNDIEAMLQDLQDEPMSEPAQENLERQLDTPPPLDEAAVPLDEPAGALVEAAVAVGEAAVQPAVQTESPEEPVGAEAQPLGV